MTVLITGSTGLVGREIVRYLVNETVCDIKPYNIRLLVRNRPGDPQRNLFVHWCSEMGVEIFFGDLKDYNDILEFSRVKDPEKSILIHCGAIFNFWQPFELLYDVNVNGTKRILRAFHHNKIKKLIHLSSVAVYGGLTGQNDRGVTEDNPIDFSMNKNYELTKAISEEIVRRYVKKYPEKKVTILRPSGIVGGNSSTLDVFTRMFFGRFVPLPRGGRDRISLVDAEDVARAIGFFMDFNKGNGETYNLVSFTPTLREVTQELGNAIQKDKVSIITIPLFVFKPLYYFARGFRKIKKPKEQSLLLPVLFQKLGQDIWIDDEKAKKSGFQSNGTSLAKSMAKFGSFIQDNPWYVKEKFSFAL
ncbi:MAG: NAD-dependent epimerase/dehydratase family protein [Candidatus Hodarchaeales archaeon]